MTATQLRSRLAASTTHTRYPSVPTENPRTSVLVAHQALGGQPAVCSADVLQPDLSRVERCEDLGLGIARFYRPHTRRPTVHLAHVAAGVERVDVCAHGYH